MKKVYVVRCDDDTTTLAVFDNIEKMANWMCADLTTIQGSADIIGEWFDEKYADIEDLIPYVKEKLMDDPHYLDYTFYNVEEFWLNDEC